LNWIVVTHQSIKTVVLDPGYPTLFDQLEPLIDANKNVLVVTREGAGKSSLAADLMKKGKLVIFCTKSYEQVDEKAEYWNKAGFHGYVAESKSRKVEKRFGFKPTTKSSNNPFKQGAIDKEAVLEGIQRSKKCSKQEADTWYSLIQKDEYSFTNQHFIGTTFATLSVYLRDLKGKLPVNSVVFFDDPDIADVSDFKWEMKGHAEELERVVLSKGKNVRRYVKRPLEYRLGYRVDVPTVWTTTEILTGSLVQAHNDVETINAWNEAQTDTRITLISTQIVQKKFDGLLPPFVQRLKKKHKVELIANGIETLNNHSNSKGKNSLSETDLIIKLSLPHYRQSQILVDELGRDLKKINQIYVLDMFHQAVGRSQGHRYKGHQCVVLVDPMLFDALWKKSKYKIQNLIQLPKVSVNRGIDALRGKVQNDLVTALALFSVMPMDYVMADIRWIVSDIRNVFDQCKLKPRIVRIVESLNTLYAMEQDKLAIGRSLKMKEERLQRLSDLMLSICEKYQVSIEDVRKTVPNKF
jgi:hypothetical protein